MSDWKAANRTFDNRKLELYLHGTHIATVNKGRVCEQHLHHRMLEINVVLQGHQMATIGSTTYEQCEGDIVIIPPMLLHDFVVEKEEGVTYFVVHIQHVDRQLLQRIQKEKKYVISVKDELNMTLRPIIFRLIDCFQQEYSNYFAMHVCSELFMQLDKNHEPNNEESTGETHTDTDIAELIAREIESLLNRQEDNHQATNWLSHISDKLGVSRRHCHRVFQAAYGMSPRTYYSIIRQQEAMHMLLGTDETIEKIAYQIGFENAQSFIRQFTKWTGMTPGEYRKREVNNTNYLTPLEVVK